MNTITPKKKKVAQHLTNRTEVQVRFSEVDSLGIVWHGHYIKFFEDGREAFGKQYGLGYLDMFNHNFVTPLVNIQVNFKKTVKYGDSVIIETNFINSPASKIVFHYKIYRVSDNELVATGESTQVFIDLEHNLQLIVPSFFEEWKEKLGIKIKN